MRSPFVAPALIFGMAGCSATASAQACAAPAHPAFEFQVSEPAAFRGDTTAVPRPARERFARTQDPETLVVQFVVDTLGVPDPRSFRVLQAPTRAAADSARAALPAWRFAPARRGGCRVPQIVQTAITH
jgi:hypothetical protein